MPEGSTRARTKLDWALDAVRRGLPVFPISPDSKKPLPGSRGFQDASTDPEQIRKWWAETPDANIGVYPGEQFVVVDLDRKKGKDGVATLCARLGVEEWELTSETYSVRTPTGGVHLYYSADHPSASAVGILLGVDIRAVGGYVLASGSTIDGRAYEVLTDIEPAPLRDDLKPLLSAPRERAEHREPPAGWDTPAAIERAAEFLKLRAPAVEGQGGDEHTLTTAMLVRDLGVSERQCLRLMLDHWNARCVPPWRESDLESKVENAYRYAKDAPGAKGGLIEIFELPDDAAPNPIPSGAPRSSRWQGMALTLGEATEKIGKAEMVIREWLPARGFTAVLAKRGTGKTVAMLDMALTLATDCDWQGQPTQRGLWAVYLCGEDPEGTRDHALAWCARRGVDPNSAGLRFRFVPMVPDLLSPDDTRAAAEYLRSVLPAGSRAVLFLDTWQRSTAGGGQNRDEEMQTAVHHAEALARSLNGPAVISFHPPKGADDTIIGSSVIENASAGIWRLTDDAGQKRIEVTRLKAKGEGNYRLMRFESQPLGALDSFGQPVTGAVAVSVGGIEAFNHDDAKRCAWADLIRKTINQTQEGPLSVNRLADLLSGQTYSVGSRAYSFNKGSTLRDELRAMFRSRPHDFGDGARLELQVVSPRLTQFRLVVSPLDSLP